MSCERSQDHSCTAPQRRRPRRPLSQKHRQTPSRIVARLSKATHIVQVLLNLAAAPSSCQAVRDAGIAMVLQSLIHSVAAALSSRSGRRSPRSQREVRLQSHR